MSQVAEIKLEGPKWVLRCLKQPSSQEFKLPALPSSIPATVPGCVHTDLVAASLIRDPYFGSQELEQRWIQRCDWQYERIFDVPASDLTDSFVFECQIDTVADMFINGLKIGSCDNEFRLYSFVIPRNVLLERNNKLWINITSPVEYCQARAAQFEHVNKYSIPFSEYMNGEKHWNMIRKAGCSFGWDWGPCIPNIGINRIRIHSVPKIVAQQCKVVSTVGTGHHTAAVEISVYGYHTKAILDIDAHVKITDSSGEIVTEENVPAVGLPLVSMNGTLGMFEIKLFSTINSPRLWYPRGYGAQNTYNLDISLLKDGQVLSSISRKFGCRRIDLVTDPDPSGDGESFYFRVNGVTIYAKGANMIPMHVFSTKEGMREYSVILKSAVEANMNCLRIWGGGRYPPDEFYDECDRLGLLIWHDLMFACSLYPADPQFLHNVAEEVIYQMRRITGHPCILIYTYNNENEELIYNDWLKVGTNKERIFIDYVHLVCDTIHPIVIREDPTTPTMPSSPSNGFNQWGNPARQDRGDIHFWGVWHGNKPFSAFLDVKPRFCSEFGFQSFPSLTTWRDLSPEEMQVNSPSVEFRQRSPLAGTKCIVEHLMRHFRFPNKFENFIYLSQLVQALAIKTAVEHWRRLKPYCSGVLYWQLNDIWPGISWSSIEHSGKWKLMHYFARRFFADVLLSAFESTSKPAEPTVEVWITSDLLSALNKLILRVDLVNIVAKSVQPVASLRLDVPPQSSACVHHIPVSALTSQLPQTIINKQRYLEDHCFLAMSLVDPQATRTLSTNTHFFASPKRFSLPPCVLDLQVESVTENKIDLAVRAPTFALFVYLDCIDPRLAGGHFSDNGFCLLPNESKKIQFAFEAADNAPTTPQEALAILIWKSLVDTY